MSMNFITEWERIVNYKSKQLILLLNTIFIVYVTRYEESLMIAKNGNDH